jgi:O-antigen/teichoic acid export membrane protein
VNVLATHAGVEPAAAGVRRVALNAISLLGAYAIPRLFVVIGVVVAARVLGTTTFGIYSTAAAFAVILSLTATLGMHALLVRDLARAPERAPALIRAAHLVKAASCAFMMLLLVFLAAGPLHYSRDIITAAVLLGIAYVLAAFLENVGAWAQAVERMHLWTEASAIAGLITGVAGALLVWTTHSVVWFCVAPIMGQAAALAWLLVRVPREIRRGAAVQRADVLRLLRALAPFTFAFLILGLYYKITVLLLARWQAPDVVGIYAAGYRFFDVAHALALVALGAVYPRLSRASSAERSRAWAGTRTAEVMLLGASLVGGALWLAREPAVQLIFGIQYVAASPVLGWLALAMPALAINIAARYVLSTSGRMDRVGVLYALAVGCNVLLSLFWIPRLGAEGAARAMALAEWVLALGMLYALRTHAAALPRLRIWLATAGVFVLLPLFSLVSDPTNGAAAAAVFTVIAIAWYVATNAIPAHERAALRAALRLRP